MPIAEQQLAFWLAFLDCGVLDQEKDQTAYSSTFTGPRSRCDISKVHQNSG
jgi:hypothetical protein